MTTTRLLRDAAAQRELEERGYVVLRGAATAEVEGLREVFIETHPGIRAPDAAPATVGWTEDPAPGGGFRNDLEAPFEHRDGLESRLEPIWDRLIGQLFVDHRPVVSTYLMKWPGDAGHLPLHQDPTFVDENESRAVTLWIALDDASPELGNGPLHVLPGSHLMGEEYRGTNTPSTFLQFLDDLWAQTVPISVRAGDALIADGRLIHGSPPNTSSSLRVAVCAPVVHREAALVHAVGIDGDRVAILPVVADFYRRTSPMRLHAHPPTPPPQAAVHPRAPRPFRLETFGAPGGTRS